MEQVCPGPSWGSQAASQCLLGARLRSAQLGSPRGTPHTFWVTLTATFCSLGNQVFPEVTRLLTSHTGNTSNSEDILSSACYTVRNLMTSQPQMAKQHLTTSMLHNVVNLCRSRCMGLACHPWGRLGERERGLGESREERLEGERCPPS